MKSPHETFEAWKDSVILEKLAAKYIWWKPSRLALEYPERIAAQVMALGDYADVCLLVRTMGEESLRHILETAQAGVFDPRSWHYWHYRLGLAELGRVPPLPSRRTHALAE